mmetsp:Transcript_154499/g.272842  ORF Transcript_154499/g.272842 Transcript_154499/m.272842 type:complete len:144 (-) Transcript_154499:369-800(-)
MVAGLLKLLKRSDTAEQPTMRRAATAEDGQLQRRKKRSLRSAKGELEKVASQLSLDGLLESKFVDEAIARSRQTMPARTPRRSNHVPKAILEQALRNLPSREMKEDAAEHGHIDNEDNTDEANSLNEAEAEEEDNPQVGYSFV